MRIQPGPQKKTWTFISLFPNNSRYQEHVYELFYATRKKQTKTWDQTGLHYAEKRHEWTLSDEWTVFTLNERCYWHPGQQQGNWWWNRRHRILKYVCALSRVLHCQDLKGWHARKKPLLQDRESDWSLQVITRIKPSREHILNVLAIVCVSCRCTYLKIKSHKSIAAARPLLFSLYTDLIINLRQYFFQYEHLDVLNSGGPPSCQVTKSIRTISLKVNEITANVWFYTCSAFNNHKQSATHGRDQAVAFFFSDAFPGLCHDFLLSLVCFFVLMVSPLSPFKNMNIHVVIWM